MKTILCIFLLTVSLGHAQEITMLEANRVHTSSNTPVEKLLNTADFTLTDGRMIASKTKCLIVNNAVANPIQITVICKQQVFNETGVNKINQMILIANEKSRNSCEMAGRYKTSEIKMAYNPAAKNWSLTNLFTVTDANGMKKTNLLSFDFDSNCEFLVTKRIF